MSKRVLAVAARMRDALWPDPWQALAGHDLRRPSGDPPDARIETVSFDVLQIGTWRAGLPEQIEGLTVQSDFVQLARRGESPPGRSSCTILVNGETVALAVLDSSDLGLELTIAVAPTRRRRGLARTLLEEAQQEARRRGREVVALVENANAAGLALFRGAPGFREVDVEIEGYTRFVG